MLRAAAACTFSTSQLPKVVQARQSFTLLTLDMCFAPQRLALFRHLNFQKCSEAEVCLAFSLANVLRATTGAFFDISTSKSAPRLRCFARHFTWKRASHHNGVQFFISHLASWLAPAAFASLFFDPPEPQLTGKTG